MSRRSAADAATPTGLPVAQTARSAAAERRQALQTGGGILPMIPERARWIGRFGGRSQAVIRPGARRAPSWAAVAFFLVVAVPAVVTAIYEFAIAADQYVCEFRFGLRSAAAFTASPATLWLGGAEVSPAEMDAAAVVQYIQSRAIIDDLAPRLDLRRLFSRRRADWLARLDRAAPIEALVRYWRGQVDAYDERADGTIIVRVRAFTAGDALAVARAIADASQRLINDLSAGARRDALRLSQAAVGRAEQRLNTALARLRDFRDRQGLFDPGAAAAAGSSLAEAIRSELVHAQAREQVLKTYLKSDAPPLQMLTAHIAALEAQWRAVSGGVAGTGDSTRQPLSRLAGAYEALESDKRFAENAYQHALGALDRARSDADRQDVYVAAFIPPRLPEEPQYPRRWRSFGIVLLAAFALWAIGCLTAQSIRDHL